MTDAQWTYTDFDNNLYAARSSKQLPQGKGKGPIGREPDLYLTAPSLVAGNPVCRTQAQDTSMYGDWQAREVVSFAFELMVADASLGLFGGPASLVLVNDSGTPGDESDDCQVFFTSGLGTPVPKRPSKVTWESYELLVPSDSPVLPQPNSGLSCPVGVDCATCPIPASACWGVYQFNNCPTKRDHDLTWSTVIRDVDRIRVVYGHPEFPTLEQTWHVGIDNIVLYRCQP